MATLSLAAASATVAEDAAGGSATLTLELNGATLPEALEITLSVGGSSTAVAGAVGGAPGTGEDFALATSTATISAGASSITFEVNLNDDDVVEGTETIEA